MKDFRGKVAAITGAASGIGRALAVELAREGARLALADLDEAGLAETVRLVAAPGAGCTTTRVDVADRAAVFAWAGRCRAGHGQVNLVFNNAGVALAAAAETVRPEDFEWLMAINFWGVVHGTQAFLPHLRASGDGHVVNLSSVFGLIAMPTQSAYNASKFAVRGYTEALRMELLLEGAPVGVTCVHPGGVATGIVRSQRVDEAVTRMTGQDADAFRAQGERMIQVTSPEAAARRILSGVRRNASRVLVGPDARVVDIMARLLGPGYQRLVMRRAERLRQEAGGS
ncbi:SDR family NAD(P)-dependent oxidoreductase [Ramlibacter sp. USB13]|uniref:SDR family NAD(P)-dependent oxidoreductase n=1 Tax=Ramlibacter cellulosilyticus TaxID=2764187 RepID=A0A923MV23_9BURK|nr:SDR family NAD(P)-dependent oxidoreductase [Ramlibacter cellulosilyticus]MBC5785556.1 SDR family NAD(P)-dependent oxidoreductase [Ramlibacter cellulosilyticus]